MSDPSICSICGNEYKKEFTAHEFGMLLVKSFENIGVSFEYKNQVTRGIFPYSSNVISIEFERETQGVPALELGNITRRMPLKVNFFMPSNLFDLHLLEKYTLDLRDCRNTCGNAFEDHFTLHQLVNLIFGMTHSKVKKLLAD